MNILKIFAVIVAICDDDDECQFDWGRYSPTLRTPNEAAEIKVTKRQNLFASMTVRCTPAKRAATSMQECRPPNNYARMKGVSSDP